MRKIYTTLFIILTGVMSAQVTANAINPSCYMQCNGAIGLTWVPGTPPYLVTINGGTNCGTLPATYSTTSAGYGATNMCACTYTISIIDGTGSTIGTTTVQLVDPPPLGVSVTSYTPPSCGSCSDGATCATASGGAAPYTYTWTPAGSNAACISNVPQGSYTVCVMDANGCMTCTVVTLATTGLDETGIDETMHVYPNPVSDKLFIAASTVSARVEIFTIAGVKVKEVNNATEISVVDLPNGVYELKTSAKEVVRSQKIIISH